MVSNHEISQADMGAVYWSLTESKTKNIRDKCLDEKDLMHSIVLRIDNELEDILPALTGVLDEKDFLRYMHTTSKGTYVVVDFTKNMPKSVEFYKMMTRESASCNQILGLYC